MTKPLPYQAEDLIKMDQLDGRVLLAYQMSLGKTATSLFWAKRHKEARPIVVVCTASLKWQWQNEAVHHIGMYSEILESLTPNIGSIKPTSKLWIVNYGILSPRKTHGKLLPGWLAFLKALKPQIVILDECQAVKDPRSKQSKAVKSLCKGVPHVIALSGTPLTNRPAELYSILNILRPDIYDSPYVFYSNYCNLRITPFGKRYDGARNLPELHRRLLKDCMIRRRKKDVLKDLPDKQRHIITLPIDKPEEYYAAVNDFVGWLKKTDMGKVRGAEKAEQITKMQYLSQMVAKKKLPAIFEWIDNYLDDTTQKLLFFAHHKSIIKELHDRYKDISVVVTGKVKGKKRQQAFDQFNKDKRTRILFGNIQAAGVGWNCTATSNTAIAELPWCPGDLEQLEDRTHGLKRGVKGKHSNYFYLIGNDTIEMPKCRLLQRKSKVLDATLDGKRQSDSLDIFDLLALELRKKNGMSI